MKIYMLFDTSDINAPVGRVLAPDKKTAHEEGQRRFPGAGVEVFSERELLDLRVVSRERGNITRWLTLISGLIDDATDLALVKKRIAAIRRCLDVLETHFAEVV
jgi:hypothetical protein